MEVSIKDHQRFRKEEINDLVRDLNFSNKASELLALILREKNLLEEDMRISHYRQREQEFLQFFSAEGGFTFCNDVQGLLKALGLKV